MIKENDLLTLVREINTDFEMKKGEIIAIGGISGIGKSTLLKIIMGIYSADCGDVFVNIHVKNNAFASYVPQGNMILSGTIRDNIRFFKDGVSESDIENACRISQAEEFIKTLPQGLDTVIGEKGIGLSEGQIQRIAIARAIISNAPILLLDESTSALDEATEKEFLNCVKNLKSKTCIIVSHKQAAFDICDKVISF